MKTKILLILSLIIVSTMANADFFSDDKDFSRNNIGNMHKGHNDIIFTFDDGPTVGVTDKILDILKEHNIKATFFVIGYNVKAHPALMKRILDEGHIVGNHSLDHHPLKNLDPVNWKDTVKKEVLDMHQLILPYLANNKHNYFRAPDGAWSSIFADFLNETEIGKQYVGPLFWDIGGQMYMEEGKYLGAADWACWGKKLSVDDCMQGYINEATRKKGGVVLMHDLKLQTADMLAKIIPELEDRGFTFSTLNDVVWK